MFSIRFYLTFTENCTEKLSAKKEESQCTMFRRRIITRNSKKPLFLSLLPSLQEAHNYNNSNNNSTSTTILLNHSYYNTYNNSNNSDSPFQKSSDRSLSKSVRSYISPLTKLGKW